MQGQEAKNSWESRAQGPKTLASQQDQVWTVGAFIHSDKRTKAQAEVGSGVFYFCPQVGWSLLFLFALGTWVGVSAGVLKLKDALDYITLISW